LVRVQEDFMALSLEHLDDMLFKLLDTTSQEAPLPCARVNKGKGKGRGCYYTRTLGRYEAATLR
jgi:hypothetical protein